MQRKSFRIVGILGDPITHSRSPQMQNAAFRKAGLPYLYLPFRVRPRDLRSFLEKAGALGVAGLNVTIPHKEAILPHLGRLSPEARRIGAVNTIVRSHGKWVGQNTDGIGFLRALKSETKFLPKGKTATILGAGGAARAVAAALLDAGIGRLWIANRTPVRARRLIRALRKQPGWSKRPMEAIGLKESQLKQVLGQTDLLVNATSVGWHRTRFRSVTPLDLVQALGPRAVVSDLVYEPTTPLLKAAHKRRLRCQNGLGMLLHQGAESFRIWTGRRPNIKVMRRALIDVDRSF